MEPYVDEVSRDFPGRQEEVEIIYAERGFVFLQKGAYVRVKPVRVTELEGEPVAAWEGLQEALKPLQVTPPPGRQLEQYWAEFRAQKSGPVQEGLQWLKRVFQSFYVRYEAAALQGKDKTLRGRIPPMGKSLLLGEPVERVVYLDGIEAGKVVFEKAVFADVRWVERAYPVVVMPAGGGYVDPAAVAQVSLPPRRGTAV